MRVIPTSVPVLNARIASVPILTFVSCCSERYYECQNQRDTGKYKILVRFWI